MGLRKGIKRGGLGFCNMRWAQVYGHIAASIAIPLVLVDVGRNIKLHLSITAEFRQTLVLV
jgi:hypothetical protein